MTTSGELAPLLTLRAVSAKVDLVGVEFTDGDPAKTKKIVNDHLQRHGTIDGVWMTPARSRSRRSRRFRTPASRCPRSTVRTSSTSCAALRILGGEPVPDLWKLPQPTITEQNLDDYLDPEMPPWPRRPPPI